MAFNIKLRVVLLSAKASISKPSITHAHTSINYDIIHKTYIQF